MTTPYFRVNFNSYSHPLKQGGGMTCDRMSECHSITFPNSNGERTEVKIILTVDPEYFGIWVKGIDSDKENIQDSIGGEYIGPIGLSLGRTGYVYVLILCVGTSCLMCNLRYVDKDGRSILNNLLKERKNTFYGLNIHENVRDLKDVYGINVPNVKDVGELDYSEGTCLSFEKLVEEYLNFPNPYFPPMNYGWEDMIIEDLEITYGSFHAYCCYALGKSMKEGARERKEAELKREDAETGISKSRNILEY
ncbi:hypothetical protein CCACVL1_15550 [Corchorus capsularis]|uniref:Uncharacterized protein n=1 Tax=Corchorus capsularis TaxID=210143 RepID=A0A1R3I1Y7_COCAP|nr:hypothetical protein CCACVL1_15550 [Corchorus capsularis]